MTEIIGNNPPADNPAAEQRNQTVALFTLARSVDAITEKQSIHVGSEVWIKSGGKLQCEADAVVLDKHGVFATGLAPEGPDNPELVVETMFIPYENLGFIVYDSDDIQHYVEAELQQEIEGGLIPEEVTEQVEDDGTETTDSD